MKEPGYAHELNKPETARLPGFSRGLQSLFWIQAVVLIVLLMATGIYMFLAYSPDFWVRGFFAIGLLLAVNLVLFVYTRYIVPIRVLTHFMIARYRKLPVDSNRIHRLSPSWKPWFNMIGRIYERLEALEIEIAVHETDSRVEKNLLHRFSWVFERNEKLTKQLKVKNRDLERAIEEQRQTSLELKRHRDHLDEMVRERTADLMTTNQQLQEAIKDAQIQAKNAEEANKAKSQFLANVSHEVRTPLNAVIGFTDMLIDTRLSDSQLDFARTIRNSSDALLTLINDILDFSKIESGELELEAIDFSPELLAYDVCELIRPQIGTKPIELVCRIGEDVPAYLIGDPTRFQQVLLNLMGNAPKFTESGEIRLTIELAQQAEGRVRILAQIQDTGIGIAEEKQGVIFEPFHQADGSTTRKYGGTGLGLSISRQLALLMGGDIWVESEVGVGSTFFFSAWLGGSDREESWKTTTAGIAGKQVLVVDDNQTNLDILNSALKSAGVRASDLRSGMEVVPTLERAIVAGNPFDCCIIDIHMPGMSGCEVARQIRAAGNPKINRLPLVAASYLVERDPDLFTQVGFDQSLIKPVRRERLFEVLGQITDGGSEKFEKMDISAPEPMADCFDAARILVAEDNVVNQKLILMMLKKIGCKVELAENGKEAVDRFVSAPGRFDLIFMDIQMPEMDGFEALKAIREKGFTDIPVVAMTAHAMKEHRDECLTAGMDDYISKPIRKAALMMVLERFLKNTAA